MIKEAIRLALDKQTTSIARNDFSYLSAKPDVSSNPDIPLRHDLDPKSSATAMLDREFRFNPGRLREIFHDNFSNIKSYGIYLKMDGVQTISEISLLLTARSLLKPFQEELIGGDGDLLEISRGKRLQIENYSKMDFNLTDTILGLLIRYTVDHLSEEQRIQLRTISCRSSIEATTMLKKANIDYIALFENDAQFYSRDKLFFAKRDKYPTSTSHSIWEEIRKLGFKFVQEPTQFGIESEKAVLSLKNSEKENIELLAKISKQKELWLFLGDLQNPNDLNWISIQDICNT